MNRYLQTAVLALIPIISVLIVLYSDVQYLKSTKANTQDVMEIKIEFSKQLAKNTYAIENLIETIRDLRGGGVHEQ